MFKPGKVNISKGNHLSLGGKFSVTVLHGHNFQ